jgi:hypothetical protein
MRRAVIEAKRFATLAASAFVKAAVADAVVTGTSILS